MAPCTHATVRPDTTEAIVTDITDRERIETHRIYQREGDVWDRKERQLLIGNNQSALEYFQTQRRKSTDC